MAWLGFAISLAVILYLAARNMPLALFCGSLVLGLMTLPVSTVWEQVIVTVGDPSILMLAAAMGLVPMVGGVMRSGGLVDMLVANMRVPQRWLLPLSAAMMGLLPMPGGALLSAPIVERGGNGVPNELKAAINNWFRHTFILIYPLSPALIASSKVAGIDVYVASLHLLPGSLLSIILGYIFYLRYVNGSLVRERDFSLRDLIIPLLVIACAPALDFSLKRLAGLGSLATLIGLTTAFAVATICSRDRFSMWEVVRRMKPWNFFLLIIGIFLYMNVFLASDIREQFASLPLPPLLLAVVGGFAVGFGTGRVDLSASIIVPIYVAGAAAVTPGLFALIYVAVFFGYMISPVHPCLVVTSEYFHVPVREIIRRHAIPTGAIMGIVLCIAGYLVLR